ncbi:MAG TPA: NAD(P)H-binding protein [Actinomycetota bacterium]|nr:NAD(P)H-binding protein [Actinomycetota bacterium]
MSLLLVDPPVAAGEATVRHLLGEGDEVRVLVRNKDHGGTWKAAGAHVAAGDPSDEDLVERACQNVRTIVVFGTPGPALLTGARAAGVGRVISVTASPIETVEDLEHVALVVGRRWWPRSGRSHEDVAVAISAADDIVTVPHGPVHLGEARGWRSLKLEPR